MCSLLNSESIFGLEDRAAKYSNRSFLAVLVGVMEKRVLDMVEMSEQFPVRTVDQDKIVVLVDFFSFLVHDGPIG